MDDRDDTVLIVSCYELGHQPIAAASAAGFLERAGFTPRLVDLSVEPTAALHASDGIHLAAFSVPMHTALRVGVEAARRLRREQPGTHVCFFGHYALLNADFLLGEVADSVVGGEAETTLVELAAALRDGRPATSVRTFAAAGRPAARVVERLDYATPRREGLPPLERYAKLEIAGEQRLAAAVEASRGCLHHCRHCPIPPVYGGRFFVVPRDVVLEDIRRVVAAGAHHVTLADPDGFNGPGHTLSVVRAMHEAFPGVTFDMTTKVEHVLKHRERLPELAAAGCVFIVSAVESLSDTVLGHLMKGHTRAQVFEALELVRAAGIAWRPSLVAFTPWTTLEDYLDVLDWVAREELLRNVEPVQFSIRLLVPPGSPLIASEALRPHRTDFEPSRFEHGWRHPDPRMDRLWREVSGIVREAARNREDDARTFERIRHAAHVAAGAADAALPPLTIPAALLQAAPPRLTEPWFC